MLRAMGSEEGKRRVTMIVRMRAMMSLRRDCLDGLCLLEEGEGGMVG